jgi:mono/diheme cytochrome c family protein
MGGNPAITAADAAALVVYLRTELLVSAVQAPGPSVTTPPATAQEPTSAPPPTIAEASTPAANPPSDIAAFTRGAKAWGEHCASCHAIRDPKDFNDAQWKVITMHMRLRAGLDGADVRDITTFLTGSN